MLGLPSGGLNRGIVIPLRCSCPPGCPCKSPEPRTWHHQKCSDPAFINEFGDIFCKNFNKDCTGFFIQHAKFQCQIVAMQQNYQQYKNFSQFAMALAQALQSAEQNLSDQTIIKFITTLNQEAQKRWSK